MDLKSFIENGEASKLNKQGKRSKKKNKKQQKGSTGTTDPEKPSNDSRRYLLKMQQMLKKRFKLMMGEKVEVEIVSPASVNEILHAIFLSWLCFKDYIVFCYVRFLVL